ncbi:MAG: DUF4358 domain-containing protein [Lachnospiraceae bacterium]|nr:DUF4358 domain-containing protein [Lachnospiraceae bacterium]
MRVRLKIINIFKYASFVAVILYITFLLNAVSGSTRPFEEVAMPLEHVLAESDLEQVDEQRFRRIFGYNAGDFEGAMMFVSTFHLSAEEVILIKARDAEQTAEVSRIVEARLSIRGQDFSTYLPEQAKLIEQAQFTVRGNYIFLAIGPNAEELRRIFTSAL